jgi:hypothetical protein
LHTLHMRRHRLDALFLIQVYFGFKSCPSVLEFVFLRVPARYIRDIALFNVWSFSKLVPLLDVHQLLMLSAGTSTYFDPETFSSVIYYNMLSLLLMIILSFLMELLIYCYRMDCLGSVISSSSSLLLQSSLVFRLNGYLLFVKCLLLLFVLFINVYN